METQAQTQVQIGSRRASGKLRLETVARSRLGWIVAMAWKFSLVGSTDMQLYLSIDSCSPVR